MGQLIVLSRGNEARRSSINEMEAIEVWTASKFMVRKLNPLISRAALMRVV